MAASLRLGEDDHLILGGSDALGQYLDSTIRLKNKQWTNGPTFPEAIASHCITKLSPTEAIIGE